MNALLSSEQQKEIERLMEIYSNEKCYDRADCEMEIEWLSNNRGDLCNNEDLIKIIALAVLALSMDV